MVFTALVVLVFVTSSTAKPKPPSNDAGKIAAPAKQTPENAQIFLANTLAAIELRDGRQKAWRYSNSQLTGRTYDSSGRTFYGPDDQQTARISQRLKRLTLNSIAPAANVCESTINIAWDRVAYTVPALRWSHVPSQYQPSTPPLRSSESVIRSASAGQRTFSWALVDQARAEGTQVFVTTSNGLYASGPGELELSLPSEDMAVRVAYAMEFLRLHCDKNAQTGF